MTRLEVLADYGFTKDPFPARFMETADVLRVRKLLTLAINSKRMVAIVADRGAGKTWAIEHVLKGMNNIALVHTERSFKEKMTIENIEHDIILTLSDEPVKRAANTRKRQLRRVLGETAQRKNVVLLIEEAHRLHGQTLASLKTLLEMEWAGTRPLFTPVLVGQYDPMRKRGVDEVRLRSDSAHMKGLSTAEAREYVSATVGEHIDADALDALSRLPAARNYLDLQEAVITVMGKALAMGQDKVTAIEVLDCHGGGMKEILRCAGMSENDLSRETGIPRSTLALVINDYQGTIKDETYRKTRQAITTVLRKRLGQDAQGAPAKTSGA